MYTTLCCHHLNVFSREVAFMLLLFDCHIVFCLPEGLFIYLFLSICLCYFPKPCLSDKKQNHSEISNAIQKGYPFLSDFDIKRNHRRPYLIFLKCELLIVFSSLVNTTFSLTRHSIVGPVHST